MIKGGRVRNCNPCDRFFCSIENMCRDVSAHSSVKMTLLQCCSQMITLLVILSLTIGVDGFSRRLPSSHVVSLNGQFRRGLHLGNEVRFFMQSDDDEAVEVEAEGVGSNPQGLDVDKSTTFSNEDDSKKLARGIFELGETVGSLFFTTFGAVFALGLILNLNGFGYQFSLSEGIRIDTLDEMRLERNLERASAPKAVSENSRPTTSSRLVEFCYRNPFAASLILTGVAVAYEEAVKVPLSRRKQKNDDTP